MTRSLVACLILSALVGITAFVLCLILSGGLLLALGLYVATGSVSLIVLTSLLALVRVILPTRPARRRRASAAYA